MRDGSVVYSPLAFSPSVAIRSTDISWIAARTGLLPEAPVLPTRLRISPAASVVTNWGAKQYFRAYQIAWTGGATIGATCAFIGLTVALFHHVWMGLFTSDDEIVRVAVLYLRIVEPIYGFYGIGIALCFATQGFGSVIWTVTANAVRLLTSRTRVGRRLLARSWRNLILSQSRVDFAHARDICRDIEGEGAFSLQKSDFHGSKRKENQQCIDRAYLRFWPALSGSSA